MKASWMSLAAAFSLLAGTVWAQAEKPERLPEAPPDQEQEKDAFLSPEEALELLKAIEAYMVKAEDALDASSQGKALLAGDRAIPLLQELLELPEPPDAASLQKNALETIEKLMKKSESKQQGAIDKLAELIKKARAYQSSKCKSCSKPGQKPGQKQARQQKQGQQQPNAQNPAQSPYDPNANDPINTFRPRADQSGRWGDLPPQMREAFLSGKRYVDDYPAEFREALKEYMKVLADEE